MLALNVSFCLALGRRRHVAALALLHVIVLIVVLFGVTALLEVNPRFQTVYRHAGIIEYILRHAGVDPSIDAYFNWPGFFGVGALLTRVAGVNSALAFAQWAPVAFNLLYLAVLVPIFSTLTNDRRRVWFAAWVFFISNWVGQDYFAPQAVAFLMWLAILLLLVRFLTPRLVLPVARPVDVRGLLRHPIRWSGRLLRSEPLVRATGPAPARATLLVLVLVLFGAIVVGHQLTPVAVILVTVALVVLCGMEVRTLPLSMIVLLAAWVIYMATGYLAGHIADLVSPLSSPGGNVNENVGQRIAGSDQHLLVVRLRLLATAGLWLLAVAGAIRCARRGRLELAMLAVLIPPFLLPVLQPYGGEILLRVFLFALPPIAYLASGLVFPTTEAGRSRRAMILAIGLTCVATVAFLFTRYGNERIDYVSPGDKAAVAFLYRTAPPGSVLIGGSWNIPWMYRDYERNTYVSIQSFAAWEKAQTDAAPLVREIAAEHPEIGAYVIVTRGSIAEQHMLGDFPAGLLEKSTAALRRAPGVRVLYAKDGTTVLRIPGAHQTR